MHGLIAASLLLLPAQAYASPHGKPAAQASPAKKICKVDPEDTESRIRRRICKTAAEWGGSKTKADEASLKGTEKSQGRE